MNMEKLEKIFEECILELKSIGIEFSNKDIQVTISKRNNKRYGCCKIEEPDERYKVATRKGFRYNVKYTNFNKYTIEISRWVIELDDNTIKNTIIHELLHCLPNCNNHGICFKKYSKYVNQKLGYNIQRTGNKEEDFLKNNLEYSEKNKYKYKIQCSKCGNTFYRKRLQKNFTKNYRCKCMGKLTVIEI